MDIMGAVSYTHLFSIILGHNKMKKYLEDHGLKNKYADSLNALAFRNLVLWVLTAAKILPVYECIEYFKDEIKVFERDFGWNINSKYLRKELRLLLPFIKLKVLFPVVVAAKYFK